MGVAIAPIVTGNEVYDLNFWRTAATNAIRKECGWHVAPVITETLVLDGRGGDALLLPSLRVLNLIQVLNDGVDVTDQVRFSQKAGVVTLACGWFDGVGSIEITLEHGYPADEVPEIVGLINSVAQRGMSPAGTVVSQSVGAASVRYGTGRDGGLLSVPLLESEKELLAPYKLSWGV